MLPKAAYGVVVAHEFTETSLLTVGCSKELFWWRYCLYYIKKGLGLLNHVEMGCLFFNAKIQKWTIFSVLFLSNYEFCTIKISKSSSMMQAHSRLYCVMVTKI